MCAHYLLTLESHNGHLRKVVREQTKRLFGSIKTPGVRHYFERARHVSIFVLQDRDLQDYGV